MLSTASRSTQRSAQSIEPTCRQLGAFRGLAAPLAAATSGAVSSWSSESSELAFLHIFLRTIVYFDSLLLISRTLFCKIF